MPCRCRSTGSTGRSASGPGPTRGSRSSPSCRASAPSPPWSSAELLARLLLVAFTPASHTACDGVSGPAASRGSPTPPWCAPQAVTAIMAASGGWEAYDDAAGLARGAGYGLVVNVRADGAGELADCGEGTGGTRYLGGIRRSLSGRA